jgi:ferric-dicitrate binding protein FerR (iron transport regulator)
VPTDKSSEIVRLIAKTEAVKDRSVTRNLRVKEACEWFVKLGEIELGPAERGQWYLWIADAANRAEYAAISAMVTCFRGLPRPDLPSQAELTADIWPP